MDDGSTDGTKEVVRIWIEENILSIHYIWKSNGGKHTALNVGIQTINSELTFIVDSDDSVTSNAVEEILAYHEKYRENASLCGYAFLRRFPNGKINGKLFEPDELVATYIETRINADDTFADKAEVFITKCLKEFPFPEYNHEKFLGEDIVWIRMARKYSMVHINKAIYIGNYLESGLTKNRRKHNIASPVGCMNRAKEFLGSDIKMKYRIKGALQYVIYGKFARKSYGELWNASPNKKLFALCFVPGILLYQKWKRVAAKM